MPDKNRIPRPLAVLRLPKNASALVTFATGVVHAMTGNWNFPSPPSLVDLQNAADALQVAETAAASRTRGAAGVRNQKRHALVTLLEVARTYVQGIADANVEDASGIILSANLAVRKTPVQPPRGFKVKAGDAPGVVKIVAPAAAKRAAYEWQHSADGGATWVDAPSTLQARTVVSGLTPQTIALFRYRALVKSGEGEWSAPVTHFVT